MFNKTSFEKHSLRVIQSKEPNILYFRPFGCICFVHNHGMDNIVKFDARGDKAIFLGYALNWKAYRVYSLRTKVLEESIHVIFD